jgi:L-alanine-DL-glutamate epimerase-like enolase superfamily enzyme
MVRIRSVEARPVRVPLEAPTFLSTRTVVNREYALVRIEGDDGHTGIGFCYAGHGCAELVASAVRNLLAPLAVGQDAHCTEGLWQRLYQEALLHGRAGAVMRALSAMDIALWDRNARSASLPLYKFLGAYATHTVDAYASGGYYLEGKTARHLADELSGYVAAGFKAVKIKVGRGSLKEEADRTAAAREAIGPDVPLMLDANNAWRDLETALRYMRIYERHDPYWIEEPFSPDDIANHARLAALTPVPVATGEIEAGRWRFKHLLDEKAAAILQTDAAVCGGITEFRRIAATAASYGVTVSPHWFHDLHVHLVASTPNCRLVEFFPDDKVLNFRRLVGRQLSVENGAIVLPTAPGLGFDFDDARVDACSTEDWA